MLRDGSLYYLERADTGVRNRSEGPDLRLGLEETRPLPRVWASASSSCTPGPWIPWKQPAHSAGGPERLVSPSHTIHLIDYPSLQESTSFFCKKAFFKIRFQNGENSSPPRNEEVPSFLYLQHSLKSRALEQAKWMAL